MKRCASWTHLNSSDGMTHAQKATRCSEIVTVIHQTVFSWTDLYVGGNYAPSPRAESFYTLVDEFRSLSKSQKATKELVAAVFDYVEKLN